MVGLPHDGYNTFLSREFSFQNAVTWCVLEKPQFTSISGIQASGLHHHHHHMKLWKWSKSGLAGRYSFHDNCEFFFGYSWNDDKFILITWLKLMTNLSFLFISKTWNFFVYLDRYSRKMLSHLSLLSIWLVVRMRIELEPLSFLFFIDGKKEMLWYYYYYPHHQKMTRTVFTRFRSPFLIIRVWRESENLIPIKTKTRAGR